jgi:hypothetical protein
MELIAVGSPHPSISANQPDGVRFSAGIDGLHLLGVIEGLKSREVSAWRTGKIRVGLAGAGRHTLLFLYEINGFGTWGDAPFSLGLVPTDRRTLPARQPHQGRLLNITLVEQGTRIVRALRAVSLSPAWCDVLDTLIAEQIRNLPEWTARAHQAEIAAAYRRWPAVSDAIRDGAVVEVAGAAGTFGTE